jgi:sugar lactone lactonase YvrE
MRNTTLIIYAFTLLFTCNSTAQIIRTYAGTGVTGFYGDGGPCDSAAFYHPEGACMDSLGNIYVADQHNHRIRKISPSGIISTIAGTGNHGDSPDGTPAIAADIGSPNSIASDKNGNLYITAGSRIKKINTAGIISNFAGNGLTNYGASGVPANSVALYCPSGLSTDKHGNVYFSEVYNNIVRKIDTLGNIYTIAGTYCQFCGSSAGDGGPATNAGLDFPSGTYADPYGNIFVADLANSRIRKIDANGYISTVAGTWSSGFSGDGGSSTSAQLHYPVFVTGDAHGNLYISDYYNHKIRMIDTSGIINTIAGTGVAGFSGDGGNPVNAKLSGATSIVIAADGAIYFTDNNRIRMISNVTTGIQETTASSAISAYPNPSNGRFTLSRSSTEEAFVKIINITGQCVFSCKIREQEKEFNMEDLAPGIYNMQVIGRRDLKSVTIIIQEH